MWLSSNEITGVSGLSYLTRLTELLLDQNAIKGDPQFPALPNLQSLWLTDNKTTGVSGLSTLTGLNELVIDKDIKTQLGAELKELEQRGITVVAWKTKSSAA